jgi:hypothetical protein
MAGERYWRLPWATGGAMRFAYCILRSCRIEVVSRSEATFSDCGMRRGAIDAPLPGPAQIRYSACAYSTSKYQDFPCNDLQQR